MKNQKIKRIDLARIHKIACEDWKDKIERIISNQKFEEDITLTDSVVKEMFSAANSSQKKILLKLLKMPEIPFSHIKSYEDALKYNREKCTIVGSDTPDEVAYKKLKAITKAVNEGKVVDKNFAMSNYYYANLFYFNIAGLRCVYASSRVSTTYANCGFRLCFFTRESAKYVGEHFLTLYEQFYAS